jgi:hypothetical protein
MTRQIMFYHFTIVNMFLNVEQENVTLSFWEYNPPTKFLSFRKFLLLYLNFVTVGFKQQSMCRKLKN